MNRIHIDGQLFRQMIRASAQSLSQQVEAINALNVFPVPDGDTGTNMNMTFTSGVEEMNRKGEVTLSESAEALSKGLLMGARGNSGVILSQLFRGFAKGISGLKEMNAQHFAQALHKGVQMAYQAVVKPVEGTILTVSREAAQAGVDYAKKSDDLTGLIQMVMTKAKESLAKTPDLLPVLKKVGVVDAGGQGLLTIYEGFYKALSGQTVEIESQPVLYPPVRSNEASLIGHDAHPKSAQAHVSADAIEHGY